MPADISTILSTANVEEALLPSWWWPHIPLFHSLVYSATCSAWFHHNKRHTGLWVHPHSAAGLQWNRRGIGYVMSHFNYFITNISRHNGTTALIPSSRKKQIEADTLSSVHTTCSASGPCLNDCHLGQKLKCFFQIHSLITCLCVTVKRQVSQDTGARQR